LRSLLVIDTAAAHCAVAVFSGDGAPLAQRVEPMTRGHAERLMPMIAEALAEAGLPRADAVAVCTGPGGFTGARLGVAAARGLALGWAARSVGVDWFAALALGTRGRLCVSLPANPGWRHVRRFHDGRAVDAAMTLAADDPRAAPAPGEALVEAPGAMALLAGAALAALAAGDVARPAPLYLRAPDAIAAAPALAATRL
jgi:tRNA threonylcarbamoyladenosine biosynthesis protein TsaB